MSATLRIDVLTMPGASLGREDPMPALDGCLPYRRQNGYDRRRSPRGFRTAVLENEILRAVFLLDLGGRLWSLVHKPSGRELLYRNPVFQPGALAVRNAWFSGGVEWNCCCGGHTPLTCSPLFAARVRADDGSPVLRLYEYERMLQAPYQMDFSLPDGSPWLLARVRVRNPHDRELPMYWWSNIAVRESPDLRVLAPAEVALRNAYAGKTDRMPMPYDDGIRDASYPVNLPGSADYFFDIPEGQRPWEAALDGDGRGLVHVSTSRLHGRKLFVWGMSPGGRHWQEFLSEPGHPYIEIQGGLMKTQGEKLPMPPRSEVAWVEAYGLMEADAKRVHGKDWRAAWRDVDDRLASALPAERLERVLTDTAAVADRAPDEVLHRGSGWGALEAERRRQAGEPPMCGPALVFDKASVDGDQEPWLSLLRSGTFPESDTPGAWMVQDEWRTLLERSRNSHWLKWLHLGVMYYHAGDRGKAREAWNTSLSERPSPWALRNLAVAERKENRPGDAARLWLEAYRMRPDLVPLAAECCEALIAADRAADMLAALDEMPPAVRGTGRIRLLEARAAVCIGDLSRAETILGDKEILVPDLREGELMLSDTWYGLQEQKLSRATGQPVDDAMRERVRREFPPPKNLDFRMAKAKQDSRPAAAGKSG